MTLLGQALSCKWNIHKRGTANETEWTCYFRNWGYLWPSFHQV